MIKNALLKGALALGFLFVGLTPTHAAIDKRVLPTVIPNAAALTTVIPSSNAITPTSASIKISPVGPSDTINTVVLTNFQAGDTISVVADAGKTITFANGVDNITTDTGADIVLDSTTKYLTLHVDAAGTGVVASLGGGTSKLVAVADKAALAALTAGEVANKKSVIVADNNNGGVFAVVVGDISAEVTADPAHCIYTPFSGGDGSTGGFKRIITDGAIDPAWCSSTAAYGRAVDDATATANAAAIEAANVYLSNRGGGVIKLRGETYEVDCSVSNQTAVAIALRSNVSLVGVKPENTWELNQQVGRTETGSVLRLHNGSNCSLVGERTGNKSQGIHNLVIDGNRINNPNPGNHGIMIYAHDSSNGQGDGTSISGVRVENTSGYSVYIFDADPLNLTQNVFADGIFLGAQSDTTIENNNAIDGASPRIQDFNAATQVSGNAVQTNTERLFNGVKVKYDRNGNTALTGLTDGNDYYVVNASATSFQVSSTYGGAPVSFSAGTGTHYFKPYSHGPALFLDGSNNNHIIGNLFFGPKLEQRNATFTRSSNSIIVSDYQGFLYNNAPVMVESSGTLPAGLSPYTVYYARQSSGSTWNLYTGPGSGASQVTISDAGTGTHTVRFGKYGEVFLYSGATQGQQALIVDSNRFADSFGSSVTLAEMGTSVLWSGSNHLTNKDNGGGAHRYIEQIGTSVASQNIGYPYRLRLEFQNSGTAAGNPATITFNQNNWVASVIKTTDATWGDKWRVTLTTAFQSVDQYRVSAINPLNVRVEIGARATNFFDTYCYVPGSASAPAGISTQGSFIEYELRYAP